MNNINSSIESQKLPPLVPLLRCVAVCHCNCNASYGLCLTPEAGKIICKRCTIYCKINTGIKRKFDQYSNY